MKLRRHSAPLLTLALVSAPSIAAAEGLEFAGAGARGTMRGGAYVVGSDDAMALLYNPANLAAAPGMQLHASIGLLFYSSCFNRNGTYGASPEGLDRGGDGVSTNQETGLSDGMGGTLSFDEISGIEAPEVCNSHRVNVVPELAYSWRISDRVGIGLGVVAPTAPGNLEFGERIGGREGMVRTNGLVLPSPARYMLVGQSALIAFPTIGVGVEVVDKLRVGASFAWGFGSIEFRTNATPFYSENIATDIYSNVSVSDSFIPRVGVGISGGPWAGVSFGAGFTYYGDLDASGHLRAESIYYQDAATRAAGRTSARIPVGIATQLPWQIVAGVRYASIREDVTLEPDAIGDSIDTERWNVEFNIGMSRSSRLREFDPRLSEVDVPDGYDLSLPPTDPVNVAAYPCPQGTYDPSDGKLPACVNLISTSVARVPLEFPAPVRHNWKDQVFFRVGGDYNVVPGRLSLSAGVSFDGDGQEAGYEQLDFQPYRRVGTHLGFTVRVNRWDINVAYAHHFNQQRDVSYLSACTRGAAPAIDNNGDGQIVVADGDVAAFCDALDVDANGQDDDWGLHPLAAQPLYSSDVVNSGRFRSHLDVLQVGATYHFR